MSIMTYRKKIELTQKQAEETVKLLLSLCQASVIGSFGIPFISAIELYLRGILILVGLSAATLLYIVSMKLLERKKQK